MEKKEVKLNGNLDEVIKQLKAADKRGESIYCLFNGHKLHSKGITVDGAYLEVTGHTKQEFLAGRARIMAESEKEDKKLEEKIHEFINRGKKIIDPDKHEKWEKAVRSSLNGVYGGDDIRIALEIMEDLAKTKNVEQAANRLKNDEQLSGSSYHLILETVTKFSYLGARFWRALNTEYVQMIPESTLELTVIALEKARDRGKKLFCDFNGVILKSDSVSMDKAFLEVLGDTKEEFDRKKREFMIQSQIERLQEKKESIAKIPELVEKGKKYVFPEKLDKWAKCVERACNGLYGAFIVENALEIMELLHNGANREVVMDVLKKQDHSGGSAAAMRSIVLDFSKHGPDFYYATNLFPLTDEDIEYIEDVRKENEELTKLHLRDIVSKNPKTDRKVTEKLIIDGLKFIAEHPGMDQEELTQALIDLGCDFSIDEINEQFPVSGLLMDGIEKGDLNCGANIVANVRDSEFGRAFAEDHFLSVDDEYSVYHFIRLRTGDESYTMERVRGQKMGL